MMPITDPSFVNDIMRKRKWSPDYSCYDLLKEVYKTQWGVNLPIVDADHTSIRKVIKRFIELEEHLNPDDDIWNTVDRPEHGDAVLFNLGQRLAHIGVWLEYDGGLVLHCSQRFGVTCGDILSLEKFGFTNPVYKRYVG